MVPLDLVAGLIEIVEEAVREESSRRTGRPIYLVAESFGCSIALSVAARNTELDLILVLANPGNKNNPEHCLICH